MYSCWGQYLLALSKHFHCEIVLGLDARCLSGIKREVEVDPEVDTIIL
jgi:hypothetical protein